MQCAACDLRWRRRLHPVLAAWWVGRIENPGLYRISAMRRTPVTRAASKTTFSYGVESPRLEDYELEVYNGRGKNLPSSDAVKVCAKRVWNSPRTDGSGYRGPGYGDSGTSLFSETIGVVKIKLRIYWKCYKTSKGKVSIIFSNMKKICRLSFKHELY